MGTSLMAIALLHWTALVAPGPNFLVISNLAASGSRRTAACAALGVTVVACIWSSLAVLGVSAIFTAHHHLRAAMHVAGGCYLIYVGFRFWRTRALDLQSSPGQLTASAAFRLGFLTNL